MQIRQSSAILRSTANRAPSGRPSGAAHGGTLNRFTTTGTRFTTATSIVGIEYVGVYPVVRTPYHRSRKRSWFANYVLKALCAVVNSVAVANGLDRDELFEKYDLKLWSYEDQLTLFTIATLPSVVALVTIFVTFRSVQGFRLAFSLQNQP